MTGGIFWLGLTRRCSASGIHGICKTCPELPLQNTDKESEREMTKEFGIGKLGF